MLSKHLGSAFLDIHVLLLSNANVASIAASAYMTDIDQSNYRLVPPNLSLQRLVGGAACDNGMPAWLYLQSK